MTRTVSKTDTEKSAFSIVPYLGNLFPSWSDADLAIPEVSFSTGHLLRLPMKRVVDPAFRGVDRFHVLIPGFS